jgi:hypothetical protein
MRPIRGWHLRPFLDALASRLWGEPLDLEVDVVEVRIVDVAAVAAGQARE